MNKNTVWYGRQLMAEFRTIDEALAFARSNTESGRYAWLRVCENGRLVRIFKR